MRRQKINSIFQSRSQMTQNNLCSAFIWFVGHRFLDVYKFRGSHYLTRSIVNAKRNNRRAIRERGVKNCAVAENGCIQYSQCKNKKNSQQARVKCRGMLLSGHCLKYILVIWRGF